MMSAFGFSLSTTKSRPLELRRADRRRAERENRARFMYYLQESTRNNIYKLYKNIGASWISCTEVENLQKLMAKGMSLWRQLLSVEKRS